MFTWRTWWGAAPWSPPPCRWWGTPRAAARGTTARSRCGATASPWAAPASSGYCMVYYLSINYIVMSCDDDHVIMMSCQDVMSCCFVMMSCHVMHLTCRSCWSRCRCPRVCRARPAPPPPPLKQCMYHNRYIRELSETFAQQIIVIASNAQNPSSARVCLIQYKLLRLRAVSS